MKLIKLFILVGVIFMFGVDLYATDLGLSNDSLVEIKPKTCDFQWWKGSKNYNVPDATNTKVEDQNSSVKK